EHFRLERSVPVVDGGADHETPRRRIDRGGDVIDTRLELATGKRQHRKGDILSDGDVRSLALAHEGREPDRREVPDHEHRIAGAAADELAGTDLALHDRAADWRSDRRLGADLARLLEFGDLLLGPPQDTQPIMRRLERGLRRAHII